MQLIAKHPYVKTEKKVTSIGQQEIEHDRCLYLYDEKVVTEHRTFPIEDVVDFSFRKILNHGGILYLHTRQGVYTYIVKDSPENFIASYKLHFK